MYPYPLVLDDAGRNLSSRPLQINDCCVRALAIATKTPYDISYCALKDAGRRSHDGFDIGAWLGTNRLFYGWSVRKVRVSKHLTLGAVFARCPKGRYLIELKTHVLAVIDGKAHDLIRLPEDCPVHVVWEFRRTNR